jgi:ribose 5-phosphate isomerase A
MTKESMNDKKAMDALKKAVAMAAVEQVPDRCVVGLGSGSTLEFFIRELGRRVQEQGMKIVGVPTSLQARLVAKEAGIPVVDPLEADEIDVAVDGADEVDPQGNLIKGGGAAHVGEKIVAAQAKRFIVIVDDSKIVKTLGERFAVPLEVVAPALPLLLKRVKKLGGTPVVRTGSGKIGPVISENGHIIVDARFGPIQDVVQLDRELNAIPGLVGHGIFVRMADQAIVSRNSEKGIELSVMNFSR